MRNVAKLIEDEAVAFVKKMTKKPSVPSALRTHRLYLPPVRREEHMALPVPVGAGEDDGVAEGAREDGLDGDLAPLHDAVVEGGPPVNVVGPAPELVPSAGLVAHEAGPVVSEPSLPPPPNEWPAGWKPELHRGLPLDHESNHDAFSDEQSDSTYVDGEESECEGQPALPRAGPFPEVGPLVGVVAGAGHPEVGGLVGGTVPVSQAGPAVEAGPKAEAACPLHESEGDRFARLSHDYGRPAGESLMCAAQGHDYDLEVGVGQQLEGQLCPPKCIQEDASPAVPPSVAAGVMFALCRLVGAWLMLSGMRMTHIHCILLKHPIGQKCADMHRHTYVHCITVCDRHYVKPYTSLSIYIYIHTCIHHSCVQTGWCLAACTTVCVYRQNNVHTYIHSFNIYLYIYIYTYIHTNTFFSGRCIHKYT